MGLTDAALRTALKATRALLSGDLRSRLHCVPSCGLRAKLRAACQLQAMACTLCGWLCCVAAAL